MENAQRKREILDVCLATFIRRGLYETSVRDLSRALALQSGGIYYWFKDKDDVVVTCAEEAALRLEEHLIAPTLQDIREPDRMMERLRLRSDELRPMMKFFASVCACSRYEERLRPVLGRLAERYEKYAARFASELHCELQEIAPYVYFAITTVTDYMIFGEVSYIEPPDPTDQVDYQEYFGKRRYGEDNMKIKLALLDSDQNYLNRIVTAFNIKYADKLEIYSFTKLESAMAALEPSRIDVLVASDTFVVESSALPKRCQLAYFVESADVDSVNDQRAICKFQKADLIYRQILSIYSEYAGSASGLKLGDDSCKVIAFTSPCGGVGSSTMAAACALHYAARGKRTLYLNFERFGSSDAFFAAEGQFDMSGIIFALKSKKTNLSMKMESCVKQDPRGVYFYSQSKVALDMLELGADEIGRLISEARLSGNYEYVIADLEFGMDRASLQILRQAGAIVWTGDGSEISNRKLARAYQALVILEQNAEVPLTARIALIYNKFSNKSGTAVTGTELRSIGGAPRYEHASTAQVLEQLAPKELFDKIQ